MSHRPSIGSRACAAAGVALGVALAATAASAQNVTYQYDSLGRVIQATNADGVTTNYDYDAAGNRASQTITAAKPIAGPVNLTINENAGPTNVPLNIRGAAPTSVAVVGGPFHGRVDPTSPPTIAYTPSTGYFGSDALQYTASNGFGSTSAAATVTVTVVHIPPIANSFGVVTVVANNTSNIDLSQHITGGTATGLTTPARSQHNGVLQPSGLSVNYTPPNGFSGSDTFTYQASNSGYISGTATVSLNVVLSTAIWSQFNWSSGIW